MLRLVALLVVSCSAFVSGYYVTVDANGEECYFDRLKAGAKFVLHFEVSEGGFYDIDVTILGPDKNVLYSVNKESSGRYAMTASQDGIYTLCYSHSK
ncbi:Transmembrane emp24 domain-containing protein 2 [Sparganum proliferum]